MPRLSEPLDEPVEDAAEESSIEDAGAGNSPLTHAFGPFQVSGSAAIEIEELTGKGSIKVLLSTLESQAARITILEQNLREASTCTDELREEVHSLRGENKALRRVANQSLSDNLMTGIIGVLLGLVPAVYELATWLAIVLPTIAVAIGIIMLLGRGSNGRR